MQGKVLKTDVGWDAVSLSAGWFGFLTLVDKVFQVGSHMPELSRDPRKLLKLHLHHPLWSTFTEELGIQPPLLSCIQVHGLNDTSLQVHMLQSSSPN